MAADTPKDLTISHFLNTDYLDYSLYVLKHRAIPSMVDGLKSSTRKALFTAVDRARRQVSTLALSGATIEHAKYHHASESLIGAICGLAAPHSNNEPLLIGAGAFGNRFGPESSAPRYTKVTLSNLFDRWFIDNEILPYGIDPENPEPIHYLPIIPWILVNGISGIAIGHATNVLPRNLPDIVSVVQRVLAGKPITPAMLPPFYKSFKGVVALNEATGKYTQTGLYDRLDTSRLLVTELPTLWTREAYIERLDGLVDEGKIMSYQDKSGDGKGYQIQVVFKRGTAPTDHEEIVKLLGLRVNLNENLTVINEHGNVQVFDNVCDLVRQWVAFRSSKIADRFTLLIANGVKELEWLYAKHRFITSVLNGTIVMPTTSRAAMVQTLVDNLFEEPVANRLVSLPLYAITPESAVAVGIEINDLTAEIHTWRNADPVAVFAADIQERARKK